MSTSTQITLTINEDDTKEVDDFFTKIKEVDNVTKNIVLEIIREYGAKDVHVHMSENFVTYFVKLASLDPKWGLAPDRSMSRAEVTRFVQHCGEKLSNTKSLPIICLKIQLYFNTTFNERKIIIRQTREKNEQHLGPLVEDLKFTVYENNDVKLTNLYNKIICYITLKAGLGNPMNLAVQKEVFLALHSVFPKSELRYFAKLSMKDKIKNLEELTYIVAGIRLFNRDCGTGGEEIDDVPKHLTESIEYVMDVLSKKLKKIMEHVFFLTTILDYADADADSDIHTGESGHSNIMKTRIQDSDGNEISSDVSIINNYIELVKSCLVVYRQYEVYIRRLKLEAEEVQQHAIQLINNLQKKLEKLHAIVKFRTAIPTSEVFPIFMKIAEMWFLLQDEVIVLHNIKTIAEKLHSLTRGAKYDDAIGLQILQGRQIITDAQRLVPMDNMLRIPKLNDACEIIMPTNLDNFQKLPIQFLGFCPVQLVELKGGLFPGNPNNGVVVWKNMYFACSSIERSVIFQHHPDIIYEKCLELARNNLELIFLLQLYDQLWSLRTVGKIYVKQIPVIIKYGAGIQTETHPYPEGAIVPDYKWNVWDLKREAILFSNLKNSLTKSVQTHKSNYRTPMSVQANVPKDQSTQSMQDAYTSVPTLQNYIFGLRGRKTNDQHVIELTRPIDE